MDEKEQLKNMRESNYEKLKWPEGSSATDVRKPKQPQYYSCGCGIALDSPDSYHPCWMRGKQDDTSLPLA